MIVRMRVHIIHLGILVISLATTVRVGLFRVIHGGGGWRIHHGRGRMRDLATMVEVVPLCNLFCKFTLSVV